MFLKQIASSLLLTGLFSAHLSATPVPYFKQVNDVVTLPCKSKQNQLQHLVKPYTPKYPAESAHHLYELDAYCNQLAAQKNAIADNEDTTPPELRGIEFSTRNINVSDQEQVVQVTAKLYDTSNRVGTFMVLEPPKAFPDAPIKFNYLQRGVETDQPHIFEATANFTIDKETAPGQWQLRIHRMFDEHSNIQESMVAEELVALGFNPYLNVVNNNAVDATAPQIEQITLSQNTVDVNNGEKTVTFTLVASDEADAISGDLILNPPTQYPDAPSKLIENLNWQATGNGNQFKAEHEVTFTENEAKGDWQIALNLKDAVGNKKTGITGDELELLGVTSTIKVLNDRDVDHQAPVVTGISFDKREVIITPQSQNVTVTVTVTDPSGPVGGTIGLMPPENSFGLRGQFLFDVDWQPSGVENTYVGTGTFSISNDMGTGDWQLVLSHLYDKYNNFAVSVLASELKEAGLDPVLSIKQPDTTVDYQLNLSEELYQLKVGEQKAFVVSLEANENNQLPDQFSLIANTSSEFDFEFERLNNAGEYSVACNQEDNTSRCDFNLAEPKALINATFNMVAHSITDKSVKLTLSTDQLEMDYANNVVNGRIHLTEADKLTVTFVDWDGTQLFEEEVAYNQAAFGPYTTPSREGHTFIGWDKSLANIQSDTTITATYQINQYTVSYHDWDDSVLFEEQVKYNHDAKGPNQSPSKAGHTFTGWDKPLTKITSDTQVNATYQVIMYTITYLNWDDSVLFEQQIQHGQAAVYEGVAPNREGYVFIGWDKALSSITQSFTTKALFKVKTHVVGFYNWDGTLLEEHTINHGDDAKYTGDLPQREGHDFSHWSNGFKNVTQDLTITAQFTIKTFEVIFVDWDDTVLHQETVNYGSSATAPEYPPIRQGYLFKNWNKSFDNITQNTTIKAEYEVFNRDDFTGSSSGSLPIWLLMLCSLLCFRKVKYSS